MNEHALYNIKRGPHGYAIGKFDRDLNLLAAYNTSTDYCSCPAGPRPTCRHRKMLPRMLAKVDQPEFYCYETQTWHRPLEAFGLEPSERGAEAALAAAGGNKVVNDIELLETICPGCGKPVVTQWAPSGGGCLPGEYDLIADTAWHKPCWDKAVETYNPAPASASPSPSPTIRRR